MYEAGYFCPAFFVLHMFAPPPQNIGRNNKWQGSETLKMTKIIAPLSVMALRIAGRNGDGTKYLENRVLNINPGEFCNYKYFIRFSFFFFVCVKKKVMIIENDEEI